MIQLLCRVELAHFTPVWATGYVTRYTVGVSCRCIGVMNYKRNENIETALERYKADFFYTLFI